MITVAHVADYWNPAPGSFIRAISRLARDLSARGAHMIYVSPRVPGMSWESDLRAAGAGVHFVETALEAVQAVSGFHPAIVHTHFSRFDMPLAAACAFTDARLFWHVHTVRTSGSATARMKALLRNRVFGARVEAYVAVSHAIRDELIRWHAPAEKIRVVHNAVDTEWFHPPDEAERAAARARYGFAADERVALFFERIPLKGGDTLVRALPHLPGLALLVAGGAPSARAKFQEHPRTVSLEREDDARTLYWAADALIFPSLGEGLPYVLLEALACGLPAVASAIPPVREIAALVPGITLFTPGDAEELRAALESMQFGHDRKRGESMRAHFGLERWSRDILNLYGPLARVPTRASALSNP